MSVRPLVHPLVRPLVCNAFVKIAENGVMQDEGASGAVYPALFVTISVKLTHEVRACACFVGLSVNQ